MKYKLLTLALFVISTTSYSADTEQKSLTFPGGEKYVGSVKNGEPSGQGTMTWPNGKEYVGNFNDGEPSGQGIITLPSGKKYVGNYKDGKPSGQGTLTFPDGKKYVGNFDDGKPSGQGTVTFPDGKKYVGGFKDSMSSGQGVFTWASGKKYVGNYKDGEQSGQGTMTWPNGKEYVGNFNDGEILGQGAVTWSDGRRYIGNFKDGEPSGQGVFTWPSGEKYVGSFKDGNPFGQGTRTLPSGEKIFANWDDTKYEKLSLTGAFGISFSEESSKKFCDNPNEVYPPNPNRLFKNYIVKCTPISKRLYYIGAKAGKLNDCHRKTKEVETIISNKYALDYKKWVREGYEMRINGRSSIISWIPEGSVIEDYRGLIKESGISIVLIGKPNTDTCYFSLYYIHDELNKISMNEAKTLKNIEKEKEEKEFNEEVMNKDTTGF